MISPSVPLSICSCDRMAVNCWRIIFVTLHKLLVTEWIKTDGYRFLNLNLHRVRKGSNILSFHVVTYGLEGKKTEIERYVNFAIPTL